MKNAVRNASMALIAANVSLATSNSALAADLLMDPPPVIEHAQEQPSYGAGFIQGDIEKFTSRDNKKDQDRWSLRGTHNIGLSGGFNAQVDGQYKSVRDCCSDDTTMAGTLHLYHRDPSQYAIGVYGHYANTENQAKLQEDVFTYGVEGAAFVGNLTLMGAVGTGTITTPTREYDTTNGRLEGRYYATDNIRFDATLAMDSTKLINANESSTHLGLRANWRMDEIPVTLFAGYRYEKEQLDITGLNLDPTTADVLYVGARFSWGSTSMKDEERNGPLWNPNTRIGN